MTELKNRQLSHNPFILGDIEKVVPTTESQKEMWLSIKMDSESTLCYNESLILNLNGPLQIDLFENAFEMIINRHESLRSVFSRDGKNVFIKSKVESLIHFIDLTNQPDQESSLREIVNNDIQKKYDLENGPLVHGILIRLNSQNYKFIFSAHHIVCDGWSIAVILNELSICYNAFISNVPNDLMPASQFSDFVHFENNYDYSKDTHFWLERFNKALPDITFPTDFKRQKSRTFKSQRIDVEIKATQVQKIKKISKESGSSLYTFLIAAFNVLQSRILNVNDVVVGLSTAPQPSLDRFDLVGHFVNLLPFRNELDSKKSFKDFLRATRTSMMDAFDHQFFTYGQLVKKLKNVRRVNGEMPLLNIVFNIDQQQPDQGVSLIDIKADYKSIPRVAENFELFFNVVSRGDFLEIECQYNSDLFKTETIRNWIDSYIELIDLLIDYAHFPMEQIHLKDLFIPALNEKISQEIKSESRSVEDSKYTLVYERLTTIWKNVLYVNEVNKADNFFAIGGHSLLAIELALEVEKDFSIPYSMKDVFENATLHEMCLSILNNLNIGKEVVYSEVFPANTNKFIVSSAQMQICFLEEMFHGTTMHNLPAAIKVQGKVDPKAFKNALNLIIKRHSALRTSITTIKGIPHQIINDNVECFVEIVSVNENELQAALNKEAEYVFNLENAPLIRSKIFRCGKDDVIFFLVHHAIWDGWSFDIFFEELNSFYVAFINDDQSVLNDVRPLNVNYIDHTAWLKNLIDSGKLKSQLDFWKENLKGPLPLLELPLDNKRPIEINHAGATFPFILNSSTTDIVRSFAQKANTSLFNVFLTAFKITLSRFSNSLEDVDDIIVGAPVRGRVRPEVLNTIGYFVNSVSLRTKIDHNISFLDNLKHVTESSLKAFDNQLLPFQIVLNSLGISFPKDRTPVFQTFFSYQDVNNRKALFNNLPYSQINVDKASTHTDLDLWIKASDQKIEGAFEFRPDLFHINSIENFFDSFINCLNSLELDANIPLKNQSKTSDRAKEKLLVELNATQNDAFGKKSFVELFSKEAKKFPNKLVIADELSRLTYRELDLKSNQFAHYLKRFGVKENSLIGISMDRTPNMLVALLGILKSHAGYVPLDPHFPQDRLEYMLHQSQTDLVIVDKNTQNILNNKYRKINFDDVHLSDESTEEHSNIPLDNIAYVIYTSGSTGLPKGVVLGHKSVANFLESMQAKKIISEADSLLAVTTLSFDISVLELFLPLISGASIFIAKSNDVINGDKLLSLIERNNITMMQATPTTWRLLLAAGLKNKNTFTALCGGEPFPIDLANKLTSILPNVWNMYGPTETTVWSTCKKLIQNENRITVGRPIDNTTIYILDDNLNLLPFGAAGNLYIGGLGLAKGYFGRDDLTRERFIASPFKKNEVIYATGDIARYVHNGEIECLGRNDGQIKLRGYRIELGEIEAQLQKIPNIKEVAVTTREVKSGDIRLIAYYSTHDGVKLDERILKQDLQKKLNPYMIPSHFVDMMDVPKTLNGKIDKKALPDFKLDKNPAIEALPLSSHTNEKIESNISDVEKMRNIWQKHLGRVQVNNGDNYFDLGGNSLIAIEMYSEISDVFGLNLRLSKLIEAQNFISFCELVLKPSVEPVRTSIASSDTHLNLIPSVKAQFKSLVAIANSGDKNPLYCFHGAGGNVLNYITLIPALKKARPLLAFQSIGLDGETVPLKDIKEMAHQYYLELKMAQPHGPYILSGGSMGGVIALEVARRLIKEGEEVEKLIMFDTFGPNLNLKNYSSKKKLNLFSRIKLGVKFRIKKLINNIVTRIYRKLGIKIPISLLVYEIEQNNYKAIWNYRPDEYNGNIILIRSHLDDSGWYSDPKMGWEGIIQGKIDIRYISGTHENFIESPELVKELSKVLNE